MDDDKTLKCRFVVTVDRGVMNVPGRANETPFVYLTRDLNELVSYTGVAPWTNGATSVPTYGYTAFGVANTAAIFEPTEKWVWLHDGSGNGVGEVNMEKGEMRVEANISIASKSDTENKKFGTKTEVKNLNSFKVVEKAILYEIKRQTELLNKGEKVIQETRGFDENTGKTYSQRVKESSHDYRYFPDPDIPKMKVSEIPEFGKDIVKKDMPELPWEKRERFTKDFGMTEKEVAVFVDSPKIAKYFESVIDKKESDKKFVKLALNYILSDYIGIIKKDTNDIEANIEKISSNTFSKLIDMIILNKISSRGAKDLLALLYINDTDPEVLANEKGLIQKSDEGEIKNIVAGIINANPNVVNDYKNGKISALQYIVGQGMKATKGSANPEVLRKIIEEMLK
jgi:aspartyl-tRNA(Asn)/glutamyl-tRNA(Gln) amidotransferase subunit B